MTDRSLAAKLRDVLSDEFLLDMSAKAEYGFVARDYREALVNRLLPLLVSLQDEQMREVAAYVRSCRESRDTVQVFDVMAKYIESGKWASPTSAAEGEKE